MNRNKIKFKLKNYLMEHNTKMYKAIIDKIINNHKDSLQEILVLMKCLDLFPKNYLDKVSIRLCESILYKATCNSLPDIEVFVLIIGDKYYVFNDDNTCSCELESKIENNGICLHYLLYRILYAIHVYNEISIDYRNMINLMHANMI